MVNPAAERSKKIETSNPSLTNAESSNESLLSVESSGATDVLNSVEGDEGVEAGLGRVSESKENVGEHRQATAGRFQQFSKNLTDEQAAELKAKLLKSLPPVKEQKRQIREYIRQEIVMLRKQESELLKVGDFYGLSRVLRRARQLKRDLFKLLHATAEVVQNIWLKVVHGIA